MLKDKRIIMIHGLESKPPKNVLHGQWKKCLKQNITLYDPYFFQKNSELDLGSVFRMAYWANEIPSHIEDDKLSVKNTKKSMLRLIDERTRKRDEFHVGTGDKLKSFLKGAGFEVVNVFSKALTLKDEITEKMLEEVRLYKNDQYIADKIRGVLEEELKEAWNRGKEVMVIAHSMGTFIAYDVLWRFSHRNVPGYREYRDEKVSLFVTIGSPLGDSVIQDLLFGNRYGQKDRRYYPTNIRHWHNYACLGDVVAHDNTLYDDYFSVMKSLQLLEDFRDYRNLYNSYHNVEGKPNPHKSLGYLVQPKLAKWIMKFLFGDLN